MKQDTNFFQILKEKNKESLLEAYQLLWSNEIGKVDDTEIFRETDFNEFQIDANIKWGTLEEIALRPTPLEWFWEKISNLSTRAWSISGVVGVILSILMLAIVHIWARSILPASGFVEILTVLVVIGSVVTLSVMMLGTSIYLFHQDVARFFPDKLKAGINSLKTRLATANLFFEPIPAFMLAAFIVFLIGGMYHFAANPSNPSLFWISEYTEITDADITRWIFPDYADEVKNESKRKELLSRYESVIVQDSKFITSVGPEFINAAAVSYELDGQIFQAQLAYHLAKKTDPFNTHISYIKNNAPDKLVEKKWRENLKNGKIVAISLEDTKTLKYISSEYWRFFSESDSLSSLIEMVKNLKVHGDQQMCNAYAVALESTGDKEGAKIAYSEALKKKRFDPTTLANFKSFVAKIELSSIY